MSGNGSFLKRDFIRGDLRLEVAREIARKAHEGQFRDTGGPYIEHPELACNIMDAMGATSEQKAVALLHDVLEDGERYKSRKGEDPQKNYPLLKEDLKRELNARCHPHTEEEQKELIRWVDRVYEGVRQLTLGYYKFEGKRTTQIDAVKNIDPEFRPVKIIDQAATVIGDILYSNPMNQQELTRDRAFALKGLDISRTCVANDPSSPYHDFYKRVFSRFRNYYKFAINQNFVASELAKRNFDLERIIRDSLDPVITQQVNPERVTQYSSPAFRTRWLPFGASPPSLTQGLAHVRLSNKSGKVVSFGLIVTPENESPANSAAAALRASLEKSMRRTVETGELVKSQGLEKYPNAVQVRDYKLSQPMTLLSFIRQAEASGAIDERFKAELARKIKPRVSPRVRESDTSRQR